MRIYMAMQGCAGLSLFSARSFLCITLLCKTKNRLKKPTSRQGKIYIMKEASMLHSRISLSGSSRFASLEFLMIQEGMKMSPTQGIETRVLLASNEAKYFKIQ